MHDTMSNNQFRSAQRGHQTSLSVTTNSPVNSAKPKKRSSCLYERFQNQASNRSLCKGFTRSMS